MNIQAKVKEATRTGNPVVVTTNRVRQCEMRIYALPECRKALDGHWRRFCLAWYLYEGDAGNPRYVGMDEYASGREVKEFLADKTLLDTRTCDI